MELNQIRGFLALAQTLNFTRAAEQCGISQPSLSRAVRKLEEEMGGPLVRRERGRTHLTPLGELVRPRLEQAFSLTEAALDDATHFAEDAGSSLNVGVMCTIGPGRLIALVNHIAKKQPQLELKLHDGPGEDLVDAMLSGKIDVALAGLPSYPDHVQATALYEEGYLVAFPAGHRFEKVEEVAMRDLAEEPYLSRINCEFPVFHQAIVGPIPYEYNVRYESAHEDWIQAMVIAGLGCTTLPEFSAVTPGILTRPLVQPEVRRTISLLSVRGRPHSRAAAAFSRLCLCSKWR